MRFLDLLRTSLGEKIKRVISPCYAKKYHVTQEAEKVNLDVIMEKNFINLEAAYRHQNKVIRRSYEFNRVTLGEVLQSVGVVSVDEIENGAVIYHQAFIHTGRGVEITLIRNADEIWNYDVFSCILKNRIKEDGYYTMGLLHETTIIVNCKDNQYILIFSSLGGINCIKYMQVTIMIPDRSEMDDAHTFKSTNTAQCDSLILSNCESDEEPELTHFEEIEKGYIVKTQNGLPLNDVEEEYRHGKYEFNSLAHYYGYGKWLLEQNRFYDALTQLKRAYNIERRILQESKEDDTIKIYKETCMFLGKCLSKLNRYDEAIFYYQQVGKDYLGDSKDCIIKCIAHLGNSHASHAYSIEPDLIQQFNEKGDIRHILKNSPDSFREYVSNNKSYRHEITIEYILDLFFMVKKNNLAPFLIVYDSIENRIEECLEDVDSICSYPLNTKRAMDKVLVLSCSHTSHYSKNEDEDLSCLCINAPIIISTHAIHTNEGLVTMRVDAMRCNFTNDPDKSDICEHNQPIYESFCMGFAGEDNFIVERESLLSAIKKCDDYIRSHRFLETLKLSQWVLGCTLHLLKNEFGLIERNSSDRMLWNLYNESCYRIGYCLMEFERYTQANYYLRLASWSGTYQHVQEYINCLSNSNDLNILEMVDYVIKHSPKPKSKDGIEAWNNHMAFLKRRRLYALIERKDYDKVIPLIKEMLKDPLCKKFAEDELNYLKQNSLIQ